MRTVFGPSGMEVEDVVSRVECGRGWSGRKPRWLRRPDIISNGLLVERHSSSQGFLLATASYILAWRLDLLGFSAAKLAVPILELNLSYVRCHRIRED